MKIAVISDIHSNLEALTACCQMAMEQGAEKFVCLGDIVGYGPDPVAVIDMLRGLPGFTCILGNHDEYMYNSIDVKSTAPVQEVAEWTVEQLSEQHIEFLKTLPYVLVENGVSYVHASLNNPGNWSYIIKPDSAKKCLDSASTNLVFYGHVHIPMLFHENQDNSVELIYPQAGQKFLLRPNQRYLINVGSVGQPRDDNNDASFVMYDEEIHAVSFFRVAYDVDRTIEKIHEYKLHEEFAKRLRTGR
ncbi:MAG: metallophosphoesterase family protein [Gammaproteobacteria bacterium]|nr:metallophosphoesterase family protein [Gammaproteobacteria bacterium]